MGVGLLKAGEQNRICKKRVTKLLPSRLLITIAAGVTSSRHSDRRSHPNPPWQWIEVRKSIQRMETQTVTHECGLVADLLHHVLDDGVCVYDIFFSSGDRPARWRLTYLRMQPPTKKTLSANYTYIYIYRCYLNCVDPWKVLINVEL